MFHRVFQRGWMGWIGLSDLPTYACALSLSRSSATLMDGRETAILRALSIPSSHTCKRCLSVRRVRSEARIERSPKNVGSQRADSRRHHTTHCLHMGQLYPSSHLSSSTLCNSNLGSHPQDTGPPSDNSSSMSDESHSLSHQRDDPGTVNNNPNTQPKQ